MLMSEDPESIDIPEIDPGSYTKVGIAVVVAVIVLILITVGAYSFAKRKSGTVVLPGGTTYLGPPKTDTPTTKAPPGQMPSKFTAGANVPWNQFKSKVYGYTFNYPSTLSLITFPNDNTDAAAFSWGNIPPQNNIMARVADLNKTEVQMSAYINRPKLEYAKNWYKQFSGLKGVKSVEPFTNSKGMKGYKTKFINLSNETPNDDIFFEIPGRPELMVRFGNGYLETEIFNKIVDSFSWPK